MAPNARRRLRVAAVVLVHGVIVSSRYLLPTAAELAAEYLRWQRNAPDEHLAILPVMARDLADMGLRRAATLLRVMLDDRIEDKLPHVQAPTLVVHGDRDRLVPPGWADEVVRLLPHGRLATVPGYAHMPHWSGPLALAPVLRAFLRADGLPAGTPRSV